MRPAGVETPCEYRPNGLRMPVGLSGLPIATPLPNAGRRYDRPARHDKVPMKARCRFLVQFPCPRVLLGAAGGERATGAGHQGHGARMAYVLRPFWRCMFRDWRIAGLETGFLQGPWRRARLATEKKAERTEMITLRQAALALAAGATGAALAGPALALDEVSYGTNWLAEAEHGGFYQAVVDGTYEKHGLKVTIVQGGPQAANQALLLSDKIQFYMGGMLGAFHAIEQGVPVTEVAALFQKDPQVLIAHPDTGIEKFGDLAKLPTIFMGKDGFTTYFQWMKSAYPGFKDEQYKPYQFNPAPFLADKNSAQQGYITSEPFAIEQQGGFKPKLFLLADNGYDPYSTTIEVKQDYLAKNPDIVQRFVDASIIGWYNYLYGDNKAANELIKKDNPEITDEQIAFSIAKMKEYGIVDSGDTTTMGIGCMTDARQKEFYDKLVKANVIKADLDISKSYTTQFVCKKVGLELKK
jgi:NitT/TauT family transport system substrate-binding protein